MADSKSFARWLTAILLLIPITFLIIATTWRQRLGSAVDQNLARIRAQKLPTHPDEIPTWRPLLSDSENGATALLQALAAIHPYTGKDAATNTAFESSAFNQLLSTNQWLPETRRLVQAFLRTNAAAFTQLNQSLTNARFQFPLDHSDGLSQKLPHLGPIRRAAQLFAVKASFDSQNSDPNAWLHDIQTILNLARALDEEPINLSWLVRNSAIQFAARAVQRHLNLTNLTEAHCLTLEKAFQDRFATNLLPATIAMDRALSLPYFRMSPAQLAQVLNENDPNQSESSPTTSPENETMKSLAIRATGFMERDMRFYLESMEKIEQAVKLPPPQSLTLSNVFNEIKTNSKLHIWTGIFITPLEKITVRDAAIRANVANVTTALAIERFRQKNNRLPQTLNELTPQFLPTLPIDPFDGQPLRYKTTDLGYILYSVDEDGLDNGGQPRPASQRTLPTAAKTNAHDLVFTVNR